MPEIVAAHLERVAKARTEMALLKLYREQARLLRIMTDQCQGLDGGARLIEENLAAALAACAREERLEEANAAYWSWKLSHEDFGANQQKRLDELRKEG